MTTLKITFDARMSEHSGIGTYIKNLLREMSKDPKVELTVICKNQNNLDLENVKKIHYCETDIYTIKEQFELIKFFPKPEKNSYFWSPHINIPLFYGCENLIVTVHDLLFFEEDLFPQSLPKKLYRDLFFNRLSKKAKLIFTPSRFTKDQLKNRYPVTENKTIVTHLGVGREWKMDQAQNKRKEIIFIGNIKKNKNLSSLIKAFDQIKNKIPHQLIIIGASHNLRSKEDLSKFNIDPNRVRIEGRLSDQELIKKISEAELVVCPSLYEGFGLVPLETYATGTKILCSDIPVHKETMGEFAEFFESSSIESLAQKIIETLNKNTEFKKEKFFKRYDWTKTANQSLEAFKSI